MSGELCLVKMYPSREEFTELIYYIAELKHQYSSKIDEQTIKINDQSGVIEELLFQIRELSDKVRQVNQKVIEVEKALADTRRERDQNSCVCRYENHLPGHVVPNRSIFSRQTSMISSRNTMRVAKNGANRLPNERINVSYRISMEFLNVFQIRWQTIKTRTTFTRQSSSVIHRRTSTQNRSKTTAC